MAIFTVVDERYNVDVYHTQKAVCDSMSKHVLYCDHADKDVADPLPVSAGMIAKVLRKDSVVQLYESGERKWKYRIQKHN